MKVVLTHGYFLKEDEKELEIMRPYPTLGILYISAFLKEHNKDVSIIDSTFISKEIWKKELEQLKPKVIAFYGNLMTKINVLELQRLAKTILPGCITCIGGPDVTYNVENYLNAGFDFAILGEGEETLNELCNSIENSGNVEEIQGLSFFKNKELIQTDSRIKIKDLQSLPFPDRSAIPIEKYLSTWRKHHGKRTVNISTQRGCPYTCKWCSTAVFGQSYRRNTPERVVEEILKLKAEYSVEALWFVDDVFTVSHKWIGELYNEFIKSGLTIPFEIITRAERLNDKILDQLKEMGCFRIWIGAESGSQKIIDKMDRRVTLDVVQSMIQRTQEKGMEAGTFIMVGYPGELEEDIVATMEHIKKCNPSILTITKAYPIKGTDLYSETESLFNNQLNWETSTDRDITFELPYSDKYYEYAIRYLVNGWQAHRNSSIMAYLKSKLAKGIMRWVK